MRKMMSNTVIPWFREKERCEGKKDVKKKEDVKLLIE
jgi:hypothetical protein